MLDKIKSILVNYLNEKGISRPDFVVERPKNTKFGHISTNLSMKLARELRKSPLEIAKSISADLEGKIKDVRLIDVAAPGFINFTLEDSYFQKIVDEVIKDGNEFRKSLAHKSETVQVEFVSANPTGPLTIGHGRQAILGDAIARILEWHGYDVTREYYFNDAGRQMRMLGESVYARYMEILGKEYPIPEGGYEGEYIIDIAKLFREEKGDHFTQNPQDQVFIDFATFEVFKSIRSTLEKLDIFHDVFYNEKDLYKTGKIKEVLSLLEEKDYTYQFEGATWFKTTAFGAEKDRVLVKSSGEPTYRLPDIAYHREKLNRNFDLIIDIFGSDHHATYPDVESGLKAMGYNTDSIRVLLHQFVTLTENGQKIKMSTRKANFVTLDELTDITNKDVVRYFYLMRSMDSHLNFDIALAQKESDENPVYYIQYAHARMNNILLHSKEKGIDTFEDGDVSLLKESEILDILRAIDEFPELMQLSLKTLDPVYVTNFTYNLAMAFHKFYAKHRVVTEDIELSKARLKLILSVKMILANLLNILGISAPDSM